MIKLTNTVLITLILAMLMLGAPKQLSAQTKKQYFVELSPLYFFYQGGGGAIGSEKGRWQNGIAFNTFNPQEFYNEGKINLLGSVKAIRAMSFEPFTKFYFSKERKWLYLGLNIVPEFYRLRDDVTGEESLSLSAYAKPKVGLRWFPFKRIFYVDAGYAMSIHILDTDISEIQQAKPEWNNFVGTPEISVGIRIK